MKGRKGLLAVAAVAVLASVIAACDLAWAVVLAVNPNPIPGLPPVPNPFGLEPARGLIGPALNELRADVSLPPVRGVIRDYWHSPDRVIGLFPDWFAKPQAETIADKRRSHSSAHSGCLPAKRHHLDTNRRQGRGAWSRGRRARFVPSGPGTEGATWATTDTRDQHPEGRSTTAISRARAWAAARTVTRADGCRAVERTAIVKTPSCGVAVGRRW